MVGGLVQNQQLRRAHQRLCQRHALALAAGKSADFSGEIVDAQFGQHGFGLKFVFFPEGLPQSGKDLIQNIHFVVHFRRFGKAWKSARRDRRSPGPNPGLPGRPVSSKGWIYPRRFCQSIRFYPRRSYKAPHPSKADGRRNFSIFFPPKAACFLLSRLCFRAHGRPRQYSTNARKSKSSPDEKSGKGGFLPEFRADFPDAYCISRRNMGYYFL